MSTPKEKLEGIIKNSESVGTLPALLVVELVSGEASLADLVESLGYLLTDKDAEQRVNGTRILSSVISLLPPDKLTSTECQLLSSFYCDRLNDHYSVVPSTLGGIAALVAMDNIPSTAPGEILLALNKDVMCQTLTVSYRKTYYEIYYNIFSKKRDIVMNTSLKNTFLPGLIMAMSGESDPRNLVFLFSFLPPVLSSLEIDSHADEVFDVLEAYFPVDYTPANENDPVSREILARGLEACLTSNSLLANSAYPLLCEKLQSSLPVAQQDSLRLLISGVRSWGLTGLSDHIDEVWVSLSKVLTSSNQEVSSLAVQALTALLSAFSSSALSEKDAKAFNYLLDSTSSSTHLFLGDPALSLFTPTLKLLAAVASVSSATSDYIFPRVVPQLIALLKSDCSCSAKESVLKGLQPFLIYALKYESWKNKNARGIIEEIPSLLIGFLRNPESRGAALSCLSAALPKTTVEQREVTLKQILQSVPHDTSSYSREECAKFVTLVSEKHPEEIENILSTFSIPDEFNSDKSRRLIEFLLWVMEEKSLTTKAAKIFLNFFSLNETCGKRRADAIFVLSEYARNKGEDGSILQTLAGKECGLTLTIANFYLRNTIDFDDSELSAASLLILSLMTSLSSEEQLSIISEFMGSVNEIKDWPVNVMVVMCRVLAGLRPEVPLPTSLSLPESLVSYSLTSDVPLACHSASSLLSAIINKSLKDEEVLRVLETVEKHEGHNEKWVKLCSHITKALVLRGHPAATQWLHKLLRLTWDEKVGDSAAEGISFLLTDSPLLSQNNFCRIGFLYKQRVFESSSLLLPEDGVFPPKSACLALSYIISSVPALLVVNRLDKLSRVLTHCLDDGDERVSLAVLKILESLLSEKVPQLVSYSSDFIPRFVSLTTTSPNMWVRMLALDCLYHYANYKKEDVLCFKTSVTTGLQKCLADKKRLVRLRAARARAQWFII